MVDDSKQPVKAPRQSSVSEPSHRKATKKKRRRTRSAQELSAKIRASNKALADQRRSVLASLSFLPCDLPIVAHFEPIEAALKTHSVMVLAGETGSGKSTQLPQLLLRCGYGQKGLIGHTQPRRLAATALTSTLNDQIQSPTGDICGYQIRFQSTLTDTHLIKVMTDGVLLTEIRQDRFLDRYEVLIIDEAHERSTNIDLLLGYLKFVSQRRPDLKIIITSATLDAERFQAFFNQAPLMEVSGRQYPVQMIYQDAGDELSERPDSPEAVLWALESILPKLNQGELRGRDGLVFLPTERHIQAASRHLRKHLPSHIRIMPLYARLPQKDQREIFKVGGRTRIILTTNVAETSLTVPNIGFVIDSGTARISRYSVHSKVQRLPIEAISQASANQRAGRCGRIGPGVCIRLYSENDFQARPAYTEPEIKRSHLAGVLLQLMVFRLGDVRDFDFLDPPDPRLLRDGLQCLEHIGAIASGEHTRSSHSHNKTEQGAAQHSSQKRKSTYQLTQLGRRIAQLPVDPQLGRILLAGESLNCLTEQLILVSFLGVQDPRERSFWDDVTAQQCLKTFLDTESDFMSILRLWDWFEDNRSDLTRRAFQQQCRKLGLSVMRLYEWLGLHRQLLLWTKRQGFRKNTEPSSYEAIHQALLYGWPLEIANRHPEGYYQGVRGRKLSIFPGSRLKNKTFPWVLVGEIIETEKLYAHRVARIEPGWVEKVAGLWIKTQHSEPFWDKKRNEVRVRERGLLLGLTLYANRSRRLAAIDPVAAREHLIRFALVQKRWRSSLGFEQHNRKIFATLEQWEHKLRRLDIHPDEQTLFDFFDARIPEEVSDCVRLKQWAQSNAENGGMQQDALKLELNALMAPLGQELKPEHWPDTWLPRGGLNTDPFSLTYLFDMSHQDDGVTLHVSEARMNELTSAQLSWFVPGYRVELLAALVRAFPKAVRRQLPPFPNWRDQAISWLLQRELGSKNHPPDRQESLVDALCHFWFREYGVTIEPRDCQLEQVPAWLSFRIQIEGVDGTVLEQGRNWEALCQATASKARRLTISSPQSSKHSLASKKGAINKKQDDEGTNFYTDWTFGDLPQQLCAQSISGGGAPRSFDGQRVASSSAVSGYCALIDKGDGVEIGAFSQQGAARVQHRQGVIRLYLLRARQAARSLKKEARLTQESLVFGQSPSELFDQLLSKATDHCFVTYLDNLYLHDAFEQCWSDRRQFFAGNFRALLDMFKELAQKVYSVRQRLLELKTPPVQPTRQAIERQLSRLLSPHFIEQTPWSWFERLPVYCEGMLSRMERLQGNLERDAELERRIKQLDIELDQALSERAFPQDALVQIRWQLEELRLSFFAQQIRTCIKVSEKRIKKQIDEYR